MGEGRKPMVAYLDGVPIGEVQKLAFTGPRDSVEMFPSSLTFTIQIMPEKMSRKRFVKLLIGACGLSRNRAVGITKLARVCSHSYWEFYYFRLFFLGRRP